MAAKEYQLVERVVRSVKTYLESAAAGEKIAEVAARYTGTEALTMPTWTVTVGEPKKVGLAHLPHLFIVAERGKEEGDGLSFGGAFAVTYQVEFAILAVSPVEEDVNWLKFRYLVALSELLAEMNQEADYQWMEWGVGGPTEFHYLLTYTTQSNQLVGDARLITSIQMHE